MTKKTNTARPASVKASDNKMASVKKTAPKKAVTKKKDTKRKEQKLENILLSFNTNLESLKFFVESISPIAINEDKKQLDKAAAHIENSFLEVGIDLSKESKEKKDKKIEFTEEQLDKLVSSLHKAKSIVTPKNAYLLYHSSFLMLISYFEYLFTDLLKFYFKTYPGSISDKNITIQLNELKEYENLDEIRDFIIHKEVESMLFDLNFNELQDYFKKTLKVSLEDQLINYDIINEARERRHIIIHNNCIINKKYLSKINSNILDKKEKINIGENITVSKNYFNSVFNEIFVAGNIIVFNCWQQWKKEEKGDLLDQIMDITFNALKSKNYYTSEKIGLYSSKIEANNDEEADTLLRADINYCIALKNNNKKPELEKRLAAIKPSTLSPIFKVAHCALRDDKAGVLTNIKNAKTVDEFTFEKYQDWPLFEGFRNDLEFNKKVQKTLE